MAVSLSALALLLGSLVVWLLLRGDGTGDKGGEPAAKLTGEVSGTVTLEGGKPLPVGWIAFHGQDASETVLATVTDGKYLAKGVPAGDGIRVTVDVAAAAKEAADVDEQIQEALTRADLMKKAGKIDPALDKRISTLKERRAQLAKAVKAVKGLRVPFPGMPAEQIKLPYDKYLLREKTPLTLKVAPGSQTHNVELKP